MSDALLQPGEVRWRLVELRQLTSMPFAVVRLSIGATARDLRDMHITFEVPLRDPADQTLEQIADQAIAIAKLGIDPVTFAPELAHPGQS